MDYNIFSSQKEKVKLPQHVLRKTLTENSEDSRKILSPISRKHSAFTIRNESESWDRQSGTTTVSWSEDMEEVATRKVIEQWEAVERTVYDENNQLPLGPVFDECLQWQNQLPHLRLVGENPGVKLSELTIKPNSSLKRKQQHFDTRENDDLIIDNNFVLGVSLNP